MGESGGIRRYEYYYKVKELADSGVLPKSYRYAVEQGLMYVDRPKEESARAIFDEYRNSIPNIPDSLRARMDRQILDALVLEKKLSGYSRDNLLRELSRAKLYHDKSPAEAEMDELVRRGEEAARSVDALLKSHNEEMERIRKSHRFDYLIIYGGISAIAVIVLIAFLNWAGNQSVVSKSRGEVMIPGLGITQGEYQRRSNCLQNGC